MGERIVGLDVGTSALRAVELVDDGHRPVLVAFGQVGLPPGAVVDGEVRDTKVVAAAIKRLWRNGGFKTNRVQLGVAGLRAITRELEMPPLAPEELDDAVQLQAEDIVPFPVDRTCLAATVVSRIADESGMPLVRVLVAAAHRDLVDGLVAAVQGAGLEPVAIDLQPAALSRAFALPGAPGAPGAPGSPGGAEVVVSIGAGVTIVAVHDGGKLQFVRTLGIGGNTVTRALSSAMDLPYADAELLKFRLGAPGHHDLSAQLAVDAVVEDLASEIHSSIRYYATLPGRPTPVRVLVTGGGARTVGLLAALQHRVDLPVHEASPLPFVDLQRIGLSATEGAAVGPVVAVPIGLALDGPDRTRFDLLPRDVKVKRVERRARRALVAAGVVVLVALGAASAWRVLQVRDAERKVATLQSSLRTVNNVELPRFDRAVKLNDSVRGLDSSLKPLVAHEVDWLVVLNQLGEYLPSTAVLNGLDLTSTQPTGLGSSSQPSTTEVAKSAIGTGSSTVYTRTLTGVTLFGHEMERSQALANVALSGSVSSSAGTSPSSSAVSFPIDFAITASAHSERLGLFEQTIP